MTERIDKVLVSLNYSPTRSQARLLIKEGAVFYKGKKVDKSGLLVEPKDIEVKKISSFVGRGGDKLESVLIDLEISVKNMVIADLLGYSCGVCISYLEWVQNNMGYYWSFDEVAGKMEANIVRGLKDTHDISKKHKIDMRRAAMVLAVQRVMEAFDHKGVWP